MLALSSRQNDRAMVALKHSSEPACERSDEAEAGQPLLPEQRDRADPETRPQPARIRPNGRPAHAGTSAHQAHSLMQFSTLQSEWLPIRAWLGVRVNLQILRCGVCSFCWHHGAVHTLSRSACR